MGFVFTSSGRSSSCWFITVPSLAASSEAKFLFVTGVCKIIYLGVIIILAEGLTLADCDSRFASDSSLEGTKSVFLVESLNVELPTGLPSLVTLEKSSSELESEILFCKIPYFIRKLIIVSYIIN